MVAFVGPCVGGARRRGSVRVCEKKEDPENNGVSARRQSQMADLNMGIIQNPDMRQEILRYLSIRDRLEYIDSRGNLTRTFYSAVALTVLVYAFVIIGGYSLTTGIIAFIFSR